jgi:hypothetical protein
MIILAKEDFPEPFFPRIQVFLPFSIVSVIHFRISVSATLACKLDILSIERSN